MYPSRESCEFLPSDAKITEGGRAVFNKCDWKVIFACERMKSEPYIKA